MVHSQHIIWIENHITFKLYRFCYVYLNKFHFVESIEDADKYSFLCIQYLRIKHNKSVDKLYKINCVDKRYLHHILQRFLWFDFHIVHNQEVVEVDILDCVQKKLKTIWYWTSEKYTLPGSHWHVEMLQPIPSLQREKFCSISNFITMFRIVIITWIALFSRINNSITTKRAIQVNSRTLWNISKKWITSTIGQTTSSWRRKWKKKNGIIWVRCVHREGE